MSEAIETIQHRGLIVKIFQDEAAQSPDEWENTDAFLVGFHDDFYVKRDGYDIETCRQLAAKPADREDGYKDACKRIEKEYHIFGLEAYIHSGVRLALSYEGNFPDRRWDVSQLGLVFISKKEITTSKAKARKIAQGLIAEWNQYLSGEVYDYTVEYADGELIDSCGGFYGMEHVKEEAISAADHYANKITQRHIEKKKAEIKNHVPLEKRTMLQAV